MQSEHLFQHESTFGKKNLCAHTFGKKNLCAQTPKEMERLSGSRSD